MEKKICSKCRVEKEVCEFYKQPNSNGGFRSSCKQCLKITQQEYSKNNRKIRNNLQNKWREKNKIKVSNYRKKNYDKNSEKIKLNFKLYRTENPEKIKKQNKKYYHNNKELSKKRVREWMESNREKRQKYIKSWRGLNKEHIKTYKKFKYDNDFLYRLIHNVRGRINQFLKSKNIKKNYTTLKIIGCSLDFLKSHIESQFTEGMSWELIGNKIHIDHIIPLSSASTEDEVYKLCHYTNLQPLWAEDNLKKSNKILTN